MPPKFFFDFFRSSKNDLLEFVMRLFVDLDGVLADFDSGYEIAFGIRPSKSDDNVDWDMVRRSEGFYGNLPPMADFETLWRGVSRLGPTILTGCPSSVPEALENKRAWVTRHLGADVPMIGCRSSEKSLHGSAGDVLIDDWDKYRHVWLKMGGHWITHVSAERSLDLLTEYLLEGV